MITVLVWVLIVNSSSTGTKQLGDYADLPSCQRVQSAIPKTVYWSSKCVQVTKVYVK